MKAFRTPLKAGVSKHTASLKSKILTLGSCFAEVIGQKLKTHKVHTAVNPFGVIYNPHSIHRVLKYAIYNELPPGHTLVQHNGIYANYDFHSTFSSPDKNVISKKIKDTIGSVHYFLRNSDIIIITYGTAWVYERKDIGEVVANCHKLPATNFTKSLLSQKKILTSFGDVYATLKKFNPAARIILTVSPVRHIKDTLELNAVSKSVLRLACHSLSETYDDVEYFPAFEIMMDDLRDYRFYKADMLHPTDEAEEYIWEIFVEQYFDNPTREFFHQWKKIITTLGHKPFHPSSASHQLFLRNTLKELDELKKLVNVDEEEALVKSQLI